MGKGIEDEHLKERAEKIDWSKLPYLKPDFDEETIQVIRSKIEQAEKQQSMPMGFGKGIDTKDYKWLKDNFSSMTSSSKDNEIDWDNDTVNVIRDKIKANRKQPTITTIPITIPPTIVPKTDIKYTNPIQDIRQKYFKEQYGFGKGIDEDIDKMSYQITIV